jgi:hypothetical protein
MSTVRTLQLDATCCSVDVGKYLRRDAIEFQVVGFQANELIRGYFFQARETIGHAADRLLKEIPHGPAVAEMAIAVFMPPPQAY